MWTRSRGRARSVDRGTRRPGIEPRNRVNTQVPSPFLGPKATPAAPRMARGSGTWRGRRDPEHAWKHHAREPGDPATARGDGRGPRWEVRGRNPPMHGAGGLTVP